MRRTAMQATSATRRHVRWLGLCPFLLIAAWSPDGMRIACGWSQPSQLHEEVADPLLIQ